MKLARHLGTVAVCAWLTVLTYAGESPKPAAVPEEEKAKLLAAETAEQKALRAELAELAKAGQKIYFSSTQDSTFRVYAMAPDGSGQECLTPAPAAGADKPHVSPDGKRFLAVSDLRDQFKDRNATPRVGVHGWLVEGDWQGAR